MSRHIEIFFGDTLADPNVPEVTIEAVGFQGKGCEAATKAFEEALGVIASRDYKPEHSQSVSTKQKQRS